MDRLFSDAPPGALNIGALADDLVKLGNEGEIIVHFKRTLLSYRQSRPTLAKTARLLIFLYHFLRKSKVFPLPAALEDWILTETQILACLQDASLEAIRDAGVTVHALLAFLVVILMSLSSVPIQSGNLPEQECADLGKKLLIISLRQLSFSVTPSSPFPSKVDQNANPITDSNVLDKARGVIGLLLAEINSLPTNLTLSQVLDLNRSKDLVNLIMLGPNGDGSGILSYYDIIIEISKTFEPSTHGTLAENVHWTLVNFFDELGKRRRHLAFLMMPPDASWPLIYQVSRRHEQNNLAVRTSYHMFTADLAEFVKEGNSANVETQLRDMLFQRASISELKKWNAPLQLRKAMVAKVCDTIRCIQQHSQSNKRKDNPNADTLPPNSGKIAPDIKIATPSNIHLWELMIETADQLYSFVEEKFFSYEDILNDFYDLVYKLDAKNRLSKDNSLVWLLLQLFFVYKQDVQVKPDSGNVIEMDVENDGHLFDKLVRLYNEEQILSKDTFTIRDLSLECAFNLLEKQLKPNISIIKQRHPRIVAHQQYTNLCYRILKSFQDRYSHYQEHESKSEPTIFNNPDASVISEVALVSQNRIELSRVLYTYMAPLKSDKDCLGNPSMEFYKGGALPYKLLDMLSISIKYRLLKPLYQMMIRRKDGPIHHPDVPKLPCIPPHIIDVVYKLLYSAPCKADLLIQELLEEVRRQDRTSKDKTPFSKEILRWFHSIFQLINYRLIRFLKYSPMAHGLLHNIPHLLSHLEHRQVYNVLESFTINIIHFQIDLKILRSLGDTAREKEIWFAESEMLARSMVMTISRLIKTRGQSDIKTDEVHRVLKSLYPYRIEWSQDVMNFFPPAVYLYYSDANSPNNSLPFRPVLSSIEIGDWAMRGTFLVNSTAPGEEAFTRYFSSNDLSPLCVLWKIAIDQRTMDRFNMAAVRRQLLLKPPSRTATYVTDLVSYILTLTSDMTCHLLESMVWKNQWVNFSHVLRALLDGNRPAQQTNEAFRLVRFLLLESNEFMKRVDKWYSLGFCHRYWTEDDFSKKLLQYLAEFPEHHEFEAPLRDSQSFDPPLQTPVPIYYANVISDFLPTLEVLIARMIEHSQTNLLIEVLDKYGRLFYYHHHPLAFVCNTLVYYFQSSTLRDPRVLKKVLQLLDFDQYNIAPEAIEYARTEATGETLFNADYFDRVIHKLSMQSNPHGCAPRLKPSLPERHFREICNPSVEAVTIATIEIILTPIPPHTIIKHILDLVLQRDLHHVGVSALTIHVIGLLISFLPPDSFTRPIWEELNRLILTDPHMLEMSEPCRLAQFRLPAWVDVPDEASQSTSDMSSANALNAATSSRSHEAMISPYIFNDYTFNLHNYTTNAPNTFLTLMHSIMHYSSLDGFYLFLEYLKILGSTRKIRTDIQLLYVCALMGPVLHRIEKLGSQIDAADKSFTTDAEFTLELMNLVKQVTTHMDMKSGWSTQALEQVFDFLYYTRAQFVRKDELAKMVWDIIRSMNEPTCQRLIRLIC